MILLARSVFVLQLLVVLPAFVSLMARPLDFSAVGTLALLAPVGGASLLFGVWLFWAHPAQRRVAAAIVATPVLGLALPVAAQGLIGGPAPAWALIGGGMAVLLLAVLALLGRPNNWRSGGTFADRRLNLRLLAWMAGLLVLLWAPALVWLAGREFTRLPTDLADRDAWVRIGGLYFGAIALPATLLACFTLIHAPVGIARNAGIRLIHGGQLSCALLTLASLAAGGFALWVAAINPG